VRNLPAHGRDQGLNGRRRTQWYDFRLCLRVLPYKGQVVWKRLWPLAAGLGSREIGVSVADISDEGCFRRERGGDVVETDPGSASSSRKAWLRSASARSARSFSWRVSSSSL